MYQFISVILYSNFLGSTIIQTLIFAQFDLPYIFHLHKPTSYYFPSHPTNYILVFLFSYFHLNVFLLPILLPLSLSSLKPFRFISIYSLKFFLLLKPTLHTPYILISYHPAFSSRPHSSTNCLCTNYHIIFYILVCKIMHLRYFKISHMYMLANCQMVLTLIRISMQV